MADHRATKQRASGMCHSNGMGYAVLIMALVLGVTAACAPASSPTNTPTLTNTVSQPPLSSTTAAPTPAVPTAPSTTAQATRPTSAPTAAATLAPKPLNVKVKPDDKLAASAVISSTGGTVSAKAADGTKFTLTIPKNALPDGVKITLTPITGVEGLPFSGGLVGAVQMAPEGLRMYQAATLTIESPRATPAQGFELVAFGYHQNGEGLYMTPSQVEGTKITIPVWHFSGDGAASGTSAEVQAAQQRVPANAEDALNQRMTEYIAHQRQREMGGVGVEPEFNQRVAGYLREFFELLKPQLALAAQDCEAAKTIMPKALMWARSVELWGFGDSFEAETDQVFQAFNDALVNCYNKAYDKCMAEDDLSQIGVMMGYLRQATLLSPAEGGGLVSRLDQSKIDKCGSLELRFNSTIDGNFPQAGGGVMVFAMTVRTSVPIKLKMDAQSMEGSAPLDHVSFSVSGVPCLKAAASQGGLFKVSDLDPTGFYDPAKKGKVDLRLKIDPGVTKETHTSVCPEVPFSSTDSLYTKFFEQLHAKEKQGNGYLIANWTSGGAGVIARKSYQDSATCGTGGTCKENTTLELVHQAK